MAPQHPQLLGGADPAKGRKGVGKIKSAIPGYTARNRRCCQMLEHYNFSIYNGVRQGGILSPFLFAVYIDELSLCLHSANIGCRLSNMIVNHLLFADDAVILLILLKVFNSC